MIEIVNGKIFIQGKETVDATLIGYALIDYAENQGNNLPINKKTAKERKVYLTDKYFAYLEMNKLSATKERTALIELLFDLKEPEPFELIKKAMDFRITSATCYNFIQTCVDAEIIDIQPKKYSFK